MIRIGILGGTFNPVHFGHLAMATEALDRFRLAEVWFIPAALPPHKTCERLAPARDRREMLKLAIRGEPRFRVSAIEIERGGRSYTVETVRQIKKRGKDREIYLVIGTDNLRELSSWKEIGALVRLCRFIIVTRPGYSLSGISGRNARWAEAALARDGSNLIELSVPVSSTEIRRRAARGESLKGMVPEAVERYIRAHKLYAGPK